MPPLPPELVTDILLCLPVTSLLRFRCLSKSHCAEIDSPDFAKYHLNVSIQSKTGQKLIINNVDFMDQTDLYYAEFDGNLEDTYLLNNPLKSSRRGTSVCASCNGLFLLGIFVKDQNMDFALWNPFTKRYKKLPPCPVRKSNGDDVCSQVWVFSLNSNSWRRIQDVKDELTSRSRVGLYANGALYWENEDKCVGFDITYEVFFDLALLSDFGPTVIYHDFMVVFGGNLYSPVIRNEPNSIEYYLLVSDSGGEVAGGSWRKEFILEEERNILFNRALPLAYSKKEDSILVNRGNVIYWYNFENQKRTWVEILGIPDVPTYNFHVCWESLVSPGNDSAFDGRAEEVIIEDSEDNLEADSD
ncbi:hypothetical protein SLEP1_g52306 [Rubroshorea leprosula]|uniref:F-box domain-containing protein n=1 Tax=Rubroshorea leprosula TaxID=152421 RepID=A0AAV5M6N2_9ROSI|nr:hypothetical protein SLEP1_g52306 [Rubroshorea leprosula]